MAQALDEQSLTALRQRLLETQAWCADHGINATLHGWRTPELAPWDIVAPYGHEVLPSEVDRVCAARSMRCPRPAVKAPRGKILAYFPGGNLFDGAAEAASSGFYDVDNRPPWDTWFGLIPYHAQHMGDWLLLAWIPDKLVPAAEAGINVNPEGCIIWLDQLDEVLAKRLLSLSV